MAVGEWDERQLCPDGSCVGVIGPEGTCKVCGRVAPNWGDERTRGLIPEESAGAESDGDDDDEDDWDDDESEEDDDDEADDERDDSDDAAADPADSIAAAPAASASIPSWSSRQLCPDGACIGVIGPDGRCKVCGKRADGAPADSHDSISSADSATAASSDAIAAASASEPSTAAAAEEEPA